MVLWILMLFWIFYCSAGKLKQCRNPWGPFTLSLDCDGLRWIWSSKLQFSCGWSLHSNNTLFLLIWPIAVASGKWFCAGFGLLGRFAWSKLMLFQRWVQMGFSSPEVSCGGLGAYKTLDARWCNERQKVVLCHNNYELKFQRGPEPRFGLKWYYTSLELSRYPFSGVFFRVKLNDRDAQSLAALDSADDEGLRD
jgi:hypothetical protein